MVNVRNEYEPDLVTPPGDTLREILGTRGMSGTELAERIGQSRKNVSDILRGQAPITPETALSLERALGVSASFWLNRERNYREYLARLAEHKELDRSAQWLRNFPVSWMIKREWIERRTDKGEQNREVLNFFGVASPEAWEVHWKSCSAALRKSTAQKTDSYALAAWLRRGEIEADEISCNPYESAQFKETLPKIRALTLEPPKIFQSQLVGLCASCGVAVVFVPELPKTASGATRWLTPRKALIQLSLRYKTDDHLWFTFFHEAAHILLHGKRLVFVEGDESGGTEEREADEFAGNMLIPKRTYRAFIASESFNKAAIRRFAQEQGIAPGIVVGRLQHDRLLPFSDCNDLKRKFVWG